MNKSHIAPAVFVSYSHADKAFVTRLKADLQTHGISTWEYREEIQPGTPDWENAVRNTIRAAQAVLLIASSSGRSSRYVKDELRIAEMYQRPIYPLWIAGTQWMDSVPLGWGGVQYLDAREGHYEKALHDLITLLKQVASASTQEAEPRQRTPPGELRNPYKGLRAFRSADSADFFGRATLIEELLEALKGMLANQQASVQSERLLALVGPSGAGKSSVVLAGLLPCLGRGGLSQSREWVYLDPIVPGLHPIESLVLALAEHLPEKSLKTIRDDLEDDSARGLHLLASTLAKRQEVQDAYVVLVVDQFEELFTLTTREEERRHFIDLLVTASTEAGGSVLVLLTLRADFSDRPMHYPELSRLIDTHHCCVLPMDLKDLRAAIEQPAALPDVQLTFEGDLVGDLLFGVHGQVGGLPLLEFTLEQLFEHRRDHCLTLEAYYHMGGVKGALARHAESTYAAMPSEEHRRAARALFLRLIDPGDSEQDTTRRRAALSELALPDAKQTTIMRETAEIFIAARLLTTSEAAGTTTVEVSHEALIREWRRLSNWLREGRQDVRLQQSISGAVREWEQRGHPRDRLYRGSQLQEANAWAARNMASEKEIAFLQASAAYQKRMHTISTVSKVALGLLVGLLVVLIAVGIYTWRTSHYPFSIWSPVLDDPLRDNSKGYGWDEDTKSFGRSCTFTAGAYHVSALDTGYPQSCLPRHKNFSCFMFEVKMSILKGNFGGIGLRSSPTATQPLYRFLVRNEDYYLISYQGPVQGPVLIGHLPPTTRFNRGVGQSNQIAIATCSSTINLYVNERLVATYPGNLSRPSQIDLDAYPWAAEHGHASPTEVEFRDAKVWTFNGSIYNWIATLYSGT